MSTTICCGTTEDEKFVLSERSVKRFEEISETLLIKHLSERLYHTLYCGFFHHRPLFKFNHIKYTFNHVKYRYTFTFIFINFILNFQ